MSLQDAAQPASVEPFGYLWPTGMHPEFRFYQQKRDGVDGMPLYSAPQPTPAQHQPLTNGQIYTAYIEAANQPLRPQDERIAFAFARAIEAAHGIK